MPVREKQPERAGSRPVVPVSGLVQAHSPAEGRVFAPVGMEGTSETDWLPEERRFEPSVPSGEGVTFSRGSEGPEVDYDGLLGPVLLGGTEGSNRLSSASQSVLTGAFRGCRRKR